MKKISIVAALFLSGCVSVSVPGLVSDTVKATKDAYKAVTGDKTGPAAGRVLAHSYVGKDSQTVAEIKQSCVNEAAQKLSRLAGKEPRYSVVKNEVVTFNNNTVANCELAVED
jgi:chemotaxis protein CheY-P-specific phosphatase CheC